MNKQKNALLPLLLSILIFISSSTSARAAFSDVKTDNPQFEAIITLQNMGIIKGYEDGTFRPDSLINKAEFLKIIFNHAGYNPREGFYETPFTDFSSGAWFAPYVSKAIELELIKVNTDWPVFLGAGPVERIEALHLLMPLAGIPAPFTQETETIFTDITPDYKYLRLVKGAEASGIFIEEENPLFLPASLMTRGDTAELIYKVQQYRENTGLNRMPSIDVNLGDYFNYDDKEMDLIGNDKFPILVSVWNKINNQYLYQNNLNKDELMYSAIGGMVNSLGDPYSVFQEPEMAAETWNTLEGNYEGIGTIIDTYGETYIIIGIIKDSPSYSSGLKIGDTILTIDGKSFKEGQIHELINAIKGPAGTTVVLEIDRDGQKITFNITRKQITLETVLLESSKTHVPSSLGYIAIYQFTDSTKNEFDAMITDIINKNPKGLILDLRNNPGGYVDSAIDILGYFFEKGETVAKLKVGTQYYNENSSGGGMLKDLPVVVLINENTASAAEIVAAALKEIKGAPLIGKTSYGKGTVQEISVYTDGSLLKLSVAKWLTSLGNDIESVGIKPDYTVIATKDDALGKTDSQLSRAIKELEKLISSR